MKDKPVILVVDDKPPNIELLEAYLVPDGYDIVKAENGEQALVKLVDNQIDLILLDLMMPGMNGFEVIKRIRQNSTIPIILVTASQRSEDRAKGLNAGCDEFVSKPIDKEELLARVRSLLRENFRHGGNRPGAILNLRHNTLGSSELEFHGKPLASGIARGKAYLLKRVDLEQLRNDKRSVDLVAAELARLDFAVTRSQNQIERFKQNDRGATASQLNPIFDASLLLMQDPAFVSSIKETITRTSLRGESVLAEEITQLQGNALKCADELTAKSLITLQDLYYRLLYNMLPPGEGRISSLLKMPAGSILVADRLTPVEVAVVPMHKVVGILFEESARYSHASILARSLGVPVIIDFPGIGSLLDESTDVLIDAYRGYAILNPTEATAKECRDEESRRKKEAKTISHPTDASTIQSANGLRLRLLCNASNLSGVLNAHNHGIKEIGLFRSEMHYLACTAQPSNNQDAAYYTGIFGVEGMEAMTVRLADMGGDKLPVYLQMGGETDPQLGARGIRFLLARPELMKKQIRAILIARGSFPMRILLPFITTVDDLMAAKKIIKDVCEEMKSIGSAPLVGIMIEVPSVALSIERFLARIDFVCLGTNDLIQYFFASNRDQDDLQKYNRFTHPAFLKMLSEIILACKKQGTPLTVCGEMASDPLGCCVLAALGATNLSIQPDALSLVRKAISKFNVAALQTIMPSLFNLDSADEVDKKLRELLLDC